MTDTPNPLIPKSDPEIWEKIKEEKGIGNTKAEIDKRMGNSKLPKQELLEELEEFIDEHPMNIHLVQDALNELKRL